MSNNTTIFITALEQLVEDWRIEISKCRHDDYSDMEESISSQLTARALAAITRASGKNSIYIEEANRYIVQGGFPTYILRPIIGVAEALLADLKAGYIQSMEEIIHGEIFADFLEMAEYLVNSGYKDASAVIAGSTLEAHLKQLANTYGVAIENTGKPKKADTINSDLVKAGAYSKLDQKNVTAWLGLRNDAAHGDYSKYDNNQVKLLISSIRDFITRNPA